MNGTVDSFNYASDCFNNENAKKKKERETRRDYEF